MSVDKELWIDLHALVQSSCIENGLVVCYFQYNDKHPENDSIIYHMRKAVRAVGFKIKNVETTYNKDFQLVQITFRTDIPEALYESKSYNDWVEEVFEESFLH